MSRILSIQSHVVSGYVGNKAAVFPLQLLGFDVDVVNSVHFSNHTGYSQGWTGDVLHGDQLLSILDGLERNGLTHSIHHVLTGYIGSESFLSAVVQVLDAIRRHEPSTRFVCDPVLGDGGKFYVPPELVQVYRTTVLPRANVVTPNQFEVEQLTGIVIETLDDAKRACVALLDMGPSLVFITSLVLGLNNEPNKSDPMITVVAAQRQHTDDDEQQQQQDEDEFWSVEAPHFPGHFTGTGDLTAALILAHTASTSSSTRCDLKNCMEKVFGTMHAVIRRTHEHAGDTIFSKELKLIASKADIENPPRLLEAKRI